MQLSKDEFFYLIGIVAITFLTLAVFFISVLLINSRNRRQKKIEILNAMLTIQENERKRIAEDLHDDIGPMLSAIKLQINSFPSTSADELNSGIKETSRHLDSVIQDIRRIVQNLVPVNITRKGLIPAIEDFRNLVEKDGKITFNFIHEGATLELSEKAKTNIYRIVHEIMNNSLKHSNCNLINLSLKNTKDSLLIIYSDNGNLQEPIVKSDGMGLSNIEQRVKVLNGIITQSKDFSEGAFYHIMLHHKHILT